MKRFNLLLFLLLIICCSKNIKAQDDYYPLVDTNRVWSNYDYFSNYEYHIEDTLIHNDTVYNKFYNNNNSLIGLIREDSTRKVFYREARNNDSYYEEELLYDFGINEGDTIEYYRLWGKLVVDLVDTVELINGSKRKRWALLELEGCDMYNEVIYWVEGIGTLKQDLLNPGTHECSTYYTTLLCCHEYEELVYKNPYYDNCYGPTNIDNVINQKQIIYPNPASDKLHIKFQNIKQIKIFNIHGKILLNEVIREDDNIDIDISHLPPGLIIVKLYTTSNETINYKLIKI